MPEPPSMRPAFTETRGSGSGIHRVPVDEISDGARESMHRIADSEIAPAMAARAGERDFEAAAAKRLGGDVIERGAIQNQKCRNLRDQRGLPADMAHAAQVAFAFFAHVGDQQQTPPGALFLGRHLFDGAGNGQQRRESGSVIGDAGAEQNAFGIERNIVLHAWREHGIEVSGNGDERTFRMGIERGQHIALTIDTGVPAERRETVRPSIRRAAAREKWERPRDRAAGGYR